MCNENTLAIETDVVEVVENEVESLFCQVTQSRRRKKYIICSQNTPVCWKQRNWKTNHYRTECIAGPLILKYTPVYL